MQATNKSPRQPQHRRARLLESNGAGGKVVKLETGAVAAEGEPPWEPCARCRRYYRLARIGRLWLQPLHDCLMPEEEPMRM
jgi:hypothetical protein